MIKLNIISDNAFFAEDLSQQISQNLNDYEVTTTTKPDEHIDLLFIDEDQSMLSKFSLKYKELPIVLFSSNKETDDMADMVIKKPFKLANFLSALQNNTLLPKVRRKECLNFSEYCLYPVKKEIYATQSGKFTKLTEKEVDIIKYLYQIMPKTASKEDLLEQVWQYNTDATTHTVETHIYRLRQKVEKNSGIQLIITENNGYRLNI